MSKVGGGVPIDPPPPSRLRVTIFSRRLLGLKYSHSGKQLPKFADSPDMHVWTEVESEKKKLRIQK